MLLIRERERERERERWELGLGAKYEEVTVLNEFIVTLKWFVGQGEKVGGG